MSSKSVPTTLKRKFFFLPLLDRYVLMEFLVPFVALILAFTFLFLVGELLDDLKDFLEEGASFIVTAKYFLLKLPENFRFILPISILLSCIYAMANMGKNNEITALRASGVSLLRCGGSIYVFSLILTGVSFWFNETVIPDAEKEAYRIKCVVRKKPYDDHKWLSYMNKADQRIWLFNKFSLNDDQKNVMIKQLRPDRTLRWTINTQRASYVKDAGWTFFEAEKISFDNDGQFEIKREQFPQISFPIKEFPETLEDIASSTKPLDDLPLAVIMDKIDNSESLPESEINRCRTIMYSRLSFPWSCFIAVLLAIPLASKSHRSGIFGFVINAILIIVAYQFVVQLCEVLGKKGVLDPFVAGVGPTVAMLIFAMYKVVKE